MRNLQEGDKKALARCISIIENEVDGYESILENLKLNKKIPVIGITGPPGAGKSTLLNGILKYLVNQNKRVGVIAVDPTSPFNFGSLLGDRIRMRDHFTNPNVFIRSLATRGSLGGVSAKTIEVIDIMRGAEFDYIFVETVGVGQSEVEIAGIADTTILVLVPESGDEIQTIKSGIMEIADIFVVNKSDREGANNFVQNLNLFLKDKNFDQWKPPIIQTVATQEGGIANIIENVLRHSEIINKSNSKKVLMNMEKVYKLIQNYRMKDINKILLKENLVKAMQEDNFNLYVFVKTYWD